MFDFEAGELLLIDKPLGWTSFDVVAKIRNATRAKKVGHGGTLDPLATGLLLLATGRKTKTLHELQQLDKAYLAEVRLGATTPTYDAEMPPENIIDVSHLTRETIEAALGAFRGAIEQMPPQFSAKKVDGVRAYKQARMGGEVALRPASIVISTLEIVDYESPERFVLQIDCGKGTYIRSLAHDLGQALGVGGYLTGLRRTRIGEFHVADAWTLDAFLGAVEKKRAD